MADPIDAAAAAAQHGLSPVELFLQADTVVKAVMILLILASAWGWAVILEKLVRLQILRRRAAALVSSIQSGFPVASVAESFEKASPTDPFVTVYKAMVEEHHRSAELTHSESQRDSLQERVHRVGQLASADALDHLQRRLPGLATIGAVAPFVGLFGTVWGIMTSFQGIAASNNTSLAVVAPGIAEALFRDGAWPRRGDSRGGVLQSYRRGHRRLRQAPQRLHRRVRNRTVPPAFQERRPQWPSRCVNTTASSTRRR